MAELYTANNLLSLRWFCNYTHTSYQAQSLKNYCPCLIISLRVISGTTYYERAVGRLCPYDVTTRHPSETIMYYASDSHGRQKRWLSRCFPCSFLLHTLLAYVNQAPPFTTNHGPVNWMSGRVKGIVKYTAGRKQNSSVKMCRARSTIHGMFSRPQYNERISWIWHCFITRMSCGFVSDQWLHFLCYLLCSDVLAPGMFGPQNMWLMVCMYSSSLFWRKFKRKISECQIWQTIFVQ